MKYHNIIKFEFHQIINSFFQQFSCTQTFEGQSLTFNYQKKKRRRKMANNQFQNGESSSTTINIENKITSLSSGKSSDIEKNSVKMRPIYGLKKREILVMIITLIAIAAFLSLLKYLVWYLGVK